ncbi:hypothetical protein Hanom_Chr08g00744951 [Helianthus anomalus]
MATLQKFKRFATQCTIAGSPTRSPSISPVLNLRRQKTIVVGCLRLTSSYIGEEALLIRQRRMRKITFR